MSPTQKNLVAVFISVVLTACGNDHNPISNLLAPSASGGSNVSGTKPVGPVNPQKPSAESLSGSCGNPNDWIPDDSALDACLRSGRVELEVGSPGYIVNGLNGDVTRGLWLSRSGTVLTSKGGRARIIAGRDLFTGILQTPPGVSIDNFVIENISFDGMVDEMRSDGPYRRRRDDCNGNENPGNIFLKGSGFKFKNNDSQHAVCGTGLGLDGNFDVENNYIAYNGRDRFSGGGGFPWSDGMTVINCDHGYIGHNVFVDNTDIDLVSGGGHGCIVEQNTIAHLGKFGVSGMNIGNFGGPGGGDHSGSEYRDNTVYSAVPNRLGIGISIGSHPWDAGVWVYDAGRVIHNTVYGSDVNMVIDGIYGGEITGNILYDPSNESDDLSCKHSGFNYTVFPPHATKTIFQDGWTELQYDGGFCTSDFLPVGYKRSQRKR